MDVGLFALLQGRVAVNNEELFGRSLCVRFYVCVGGVLAVSFWLRPVFVFNSEDIVCSGLLHVSYQF